MKSPEVVDFMKFAEVRIILQLSFDYLEPETCSAARTCCDFLLSILAERISFQVKLDFNIVNNCLKK